VGAKTGTTNDYHDAWTIGFTPSLVTGVWAGNNDNSKMKMGADGSQVAAPIWRDYMAQALANTPVENFSSYTIPDGTKPIIRGEGFAESKVKIDKITGFLASELTPPELIEEKTFIAGHDILYYINKDNPNGDNPSNQSSDPQYNAWEQGVANWIEQKKKLDPNFNTAQPPVETDNVHRIENRPLFTVWGLSMNPTVTTALPEWSVQGSAPRGINRSEYYFNDRLFATNFNYPFSINRPLNVLPSGNYQMKVRVCDDVDNCSEQSFSVTLAIPGSSQNLNYSINWTAPVINSNLSSSSFPIELNVTLTNPEAVADLSFFVTNPKGETSLIQKKRLVRNTIEKALWLRTSVSVNGAYTLWAESYDWQGTKQETAHIKVNLKLD
jgi:membrane carboxypeptidase/penicillin-binding protein PbpC